MANQLGSRRICSSLTAVALLLLSTSALAQTPPGDQPAQPPPPEAQPAPPPPPPPPAPAPTPTASEGAAIAYPHMGKSHELMVGPDTWFRFGVQLQAWVNYRNSPVKLANGDDGKYSLDLYLRRARFFIGAQIMKNVGAFVLFDQPNLGLSAVTTPATETTPAVVSKTFSPAIVQDAFGEIKFYGDAFMLEVGLFVPPFSHNGLQSTSSWIPLDVANTAAVVAGAATVTLRDTGLQLKGYELDDHFEWRLGVFSGLRQPTNGNNPTAHNAPLISGKLQYQFFDPDAKGYVYSGMTYGKRKLLGVSAGFQFQKGDDLTTAMGTTTLNAYYAISAGIFGAWPLAGEKDPKGGDEIAFAAEFYRYDGGVPTDPADTSRGTFLTGVTCAAGTTCAAIPKQNDVNVEAAYYNKETGLGVFGKFELQKLDDQTQSKTLGANGSKIWVGGGLKYFVAESLCNFTLFYQRTQFSDADDTKVNGINQFTLQTQIFYY